MGEKEKNNKIMTKEQKEEKEVKTVITNTDDDLAVEDELEKLANAELKLKDALKEVAYNNNIKNKKEKEQQHTHEHKQNTMRSSGSTSIDGKSRHSTHSLKPSAGSGIT